MLKRFSILLISLLLLVTLLSGCTVSTKTTQYSKQDLDDITYVTKNGLEKFLTSNYETTIGLEGVEFVTNRLREETHETDNHKDAIIAGRKALHYVSETNITKVRDIEITDNNVATCVADYNEKTTSNSKDKYNHAWTGYIEVKLKKENNKWLIDDFQFHAYK